MLIWRFIQGVAVAAPMVLGPSLIFDYLSLEKAGQVCGALNSIISAAMAGAPIAGAYLSVAYGWRSSFVVIFVLATVILFGSLLFIPETLAVEKRRVFSLGNLGRDYLKLVTSLPFLTYMLIANFCFIAIVVYVANLSVICINHLGFSMDKLSYYQATTMGTFIVFSALSVRSVARKGLNYTKHVGGALAIVGIVCLFFVSLIDPKAIGWVCVAMAFLAAGGAFMAGTFGAQAMNLFPGMNGTALALTMATRQLLASFLVTWSEVLFDGTIVPVAYIIFGLGAILGVSYVMVRMRYEDLDHSPAPVGHLEPLL